MNLTIATNDCKKFWICRGGNMVMLTCPSGLIFDEINKRCDYETKITCKYATSTTTIITPTITTKITEQITTTINTSIK
jgi:hypothetical protein